MSTTPLQHTSSPLTILVFGPMQVWVHGQPLSPLRSRKALWLLALLLLRHNRPVEREWLAGVLWPDNDPNRAAANLRTNLSALRGALGDQGKRLQSPGRHTLSLDLAGADVDLRSFDAAISSKQPEALKQAVALYRGPLLENCAEAWIGQERSVREQDCLQALQTLADAALEGGDTATAIGYYRQAMRMAPWREATLRRLMEALAKSGDSNAALHVYREFVESLRSVPNAVPDEETSALYTLLRVEARQQSHAQAVTPVKVLDSATREAAVNEAASLTFRGYIPHPLTDLIGREQECVEVAVKLRGSRLVTLIGPGGIGKTRLAIAVAQSAQEETIYSDGVWLVALESLSEGGQVALQIADVVGVREEAGRPLLDMLTDHLRARRLLLVLDNCEHLLETSTQIASRLLRECAQVRVLATSRESLGILGETAWQVPCLAAPDPNHLPQESAAMLRAIADYESVQLFVERAQAYQKGFTLTGSNARAVVQVCFQLEGIPLAIELAAARVRAMTVEQIAARLNDHLALLTDGNRAAQSRQQTLRATLDWSYALLSNAERILLRRLSVFAGGWTLEAAEQVGIGKSIEAGNVLNLLTGLVEKSLVVFEEREEEVGGRYRLLEIVRQYAAEKIQASGEVAAVRQRHRDWLVMFAEEAAQQLNGAEQEPWLNRLETEHANLRATLSWNASAEEGQESELRLVSALWQFWDIHGHHSEGRQYLLQALERPEAQEATAARGKALMGTAALSLRQGDLAGARELHQQSLRIFRQLGNKRAIASSLTNQGIVAVTQGDYPAARVLLEESLSLHRELDNKVGIAAVLRSLGNLAYEQSDYATARKFFAEGLSLNKQLGDQRSIALALDNFGSLALLQGEYTQARTLFEECLGIFRELGDKYGIALCIGNLGIAANDQGDYAAAYPLFEECLRLFRELGDKQGIALSLSDLGTVTNELGDPARAQRLLEEGLTLLRQSGDREGIGSSLSSLGNVVKARGDYAFAQALLEESLTIRAAMGNRLGVAKSLEQLASVLSRQSEAQKAAFLWGAASALRKTLGVPQPLRERENYDRQVEQARSLVGQKAFDAAWEEGERLPWEQTVASVLNRGDRLSA